MVLQENPVVKVNLSTWKTVICRRVLNLNCGKLGASVMHLAAEALESDTEVVPTARSVMTVVTE